MAGDTKGEADLRRGRKKVAKRKGFAGASAKGSTGARARVGASGTTSPKRERVKKAAAVTIARSGARQAAKLPASKSQTAGQRRVVKDAKADAVKPDRVLRADEAVRVLNARAQADRAAASPKEAARVDVDRRLAAVAKKGRAVEKLGRSLSAIPKTQSSGVGAVLDRLDDELSGEGSVTAALRSAGEFLADHVNPEGGYPSAARGLPRTEKLTRNTVKDIVELPATAVTSVYLPAKEVAKGRPDRAAKMLVDPIVATAKDPAGSFEEHPVNTALIVSGTKGAVGRSAGKVLRVTKRMPERPGKKLEGTRTVEPREYSRDAIDAAAQMAVDKSRERRAKRQERKAERPSTPEAERVRLTRKAAAIRKEEMSTRDIQRRVDENVALTEDVRRANRGRTVQEARKIVKRKGRARSVATVLVAQNITKASRADLAAYVAELEAVHPSLSKPAQRANRELRRRIERVLKDPRTNLGEIEVAARRYAEFSRPLQQSLVDAGLLAAEQADRAAVIPYAVRNMGAKHEDGRLVAANGAELTTAQIRQHMRDNNVSDPAFVTQAPNSRGAKNFYVAAERDPRVSAARRTGAATREGTFDGSPEVLVEQAARAQGLKDAADGFRRFVDEFSVRSPSGKLRAFSTYKQAQKAADAVTAANGGATPFVPVRLNALGTKREQTEALLEQTAREPRAISEAIERALEIAEDAPGPYVLVPEVAAKRMREHLRVGATGMGKLGDMYGSQFRKVVLSTSPKWLAGNVAEAGVRSAVARSGPRSYATGRKVIKKLREIDPVKATELEARAVSGGHYSLGTRASVQRNAESFSGTRLEPLAQSLGKFWRTPGPRHAADAWRAYTGFVMDTLNGRLEIATQTAMLGKALRDSPLMEPRVLKLGETAIREAAEGLRDTNAQVKFAREVDRMYGKYGKFSPQVRRAISSYTPFAAWWLNSIRFVYATLPRDHPVLTALLASASVAAEDWRKEIGQAYGTELPDWLLGSIPDGKGGWYRASEFTPFGVTTTKAGPLGKAYSLVLPQLSGVGKALEGEDWKGKKLRTKDGRDYNGVERSAYAMHELLKGTVPFLSRAETVNRADGLADGLNPFKPTKAQEKKAPKKKLKKKTGNFSWRGGSSGSSMWDDTPSSGDSSYWRTPSSSPSRTNSMWGG